MPVCQISSADIRQWCAIRIIAGVLLVPAVLMVSGCGVDTVEVDSQHEAPLEAALRSVEVPDVWPELIGDLSALSAKVNYPEIARKAGVEGKVYVRLVVDEEGNAADVSVVRGIGAGLDEEAVRVISEAKFVPGRKQGKPVKVPMTIPVTFKLR